MSAINLKQMHIKYIKSKIINYIQKGEDINNIKLILYTELERLFLDDSKIITDLRFLKNNITKEDINNIVNSIIYDEQNIKNNIDSIIDSYIEFYNYRNDLKRKVISRIDKINAAMNDVDFIIEETENDAVFYDTFITNDKVDYDKINGNPVYINKDYGIATLDIREIVSMNNNIKSVKIEGNGMAGTKYNIQTNNDKYEFTRVLFDKTEYIFDNNDNTIFEYVMYGAPKEELEKFNYADIDYIKSRSMNDKLIMKMTIELNKEDYVNMINIEPFYSDINSLKVLSIRTSLNGVDFYDVIKKPITINKLLNNNPQTYSADSAFINKMKDKLVGNGCFLIEPKLIKFIEIVFEQNEAINHVFGHMSYLLKNDITNDYIRLASIHVPDEVKGNLVDKHYLSKQQKYEISDVMILNDSKSWIESLIEKVNGWIYKIALKNIDIYKFVYSDSSEYVSKKFVSDKPISKISLSVDEVVNSSIIKSIDNRYSYIRYYISFNDVDWIEISPTEHSPFGNEKIPPSLILINSTDSFIDNRAMHINTDRDVKEFRIKFVLKAGENRLLTPILKSYTVRCEYGDYKR